MPDRLSLNMCLWMRVNSACTARAEAVLIHFKPKPLNYFDTHIYRGRSVLRQVKRLSFNSSFSGAFNPATVYNLVLEKHCDLSKNCNTVLSSNYFFQSITAVKTVLEVGVNEKLVSKTLFTRTENFK